MKALGITLKDAGYTPKPEEMPKEATAVPGGPDKDEKRYATIYASERELPGIGDLKYHQVCIMVAVVKVTRTETREVNDDKKENNTTLEIHKVGFKPYTGRKTADLSDEELAEAIDTGTYEEKEEE